LRCKTVKIEGNNTNIAARCYGL